MYAAVPDDLVLLTEELERLGGGDARVGEIDVVVRVAPNTAKDGNKSVHIRNKKLVVVQDEATDSLFETSVALDERATEDDVFDSIGAPCVEWVWDGFNASVIANGESGSGKSFTLVGNNCGLSGMILASLFHRRQTYEDPTAISIALSAWEIRGNQLIDLLSSDNKPPISSKNHSQFDFSTIHTPDLKVAIDVLRESRKRSVNWHSENDTEPSTLPNRAHGFIRIVLHNSLDMRASTLHIVDCIGDSPVAFKKSDHAYRTVSKQSLSMKRLVHELCSHKKSSVHDATRGSGVLTSSRETLLNKLVAPLVAGNCKSYLLITVPANEDSVQRTRNILKSYCPALGIRCACVRLLDVQLHDLHFESFEQRDQQNHPSVRVPSPRSSILNQTLSNGRPKSTKKRGGALRYDDKAPKKAWTPSGAKPKVIKSERHVNTPLSMEALDFSNGIIPVVRKVFAHNRLLYGESEDHTMKLFEQMDRQRKGYLSALDLKRGMKKIGLNLSDKQIAVLIEEIDDNGDGMIQPEELSAAIHVGARNPVIKVAKSTAIPSHIVPRSRSPSSLRRNSLSPRSSSPTLPSRTVEDWEHNVFHVVRMAIEHKRQLYGHTIENTRTLFESLDRSGHGYLTEDEIQEGLSRLGLGLANDEILKMIEHMHFDRNHDDKISYSEFVDALHGHRNFRTENGVKSATTMSHIVYDGPVPNSYSSTPTKGKRKKKKVEKKPWFGAMGYVHKGAPKRVNSPLSLDKFDFTDGVIPVVRKVFAHNRMLYGESESHTMIMFTQMDRQRKGYLSDLDLKRGMKKLGIELTDAQVQQLIKEIDDNGDGLIQPDELSRAIHQGAHNPKIHVQKSSQIPSHIVPRSRSPSSLRRSSSPSIETTRMSDRKKGSAKKPSKKFRSGKEDGSHRGGAGQQIFNVVRMAIEHKKESYGHTIENTHTLFESIDMNGDGFLSELEVKDGLRRLNLGLSSNEIASLLKQMRFTTNRGGDISYDELTEALHGERNFNPGRPSPKSNGKPHRSAKKKRKKKRKQTLNGVRPDLAAWSTEVLDQEYLRVENLRKRYGQPAPRPPAPEDETLNDVDDPPNISKLKEEITSIMNDLEGTALRESQSGDNAANAQGKDVDNGAKPLAKEDMGEEDMSTSLSEVPPRHPYNSLPETSASPVGPGASGLILPATGENLFDLLKDEKSLNGRLQKRFTEIQHELLQRSTSYEVELDNNKIEIISLKSKVRRLEKESKYPELFEEYEKQISSLTSQLKEMQQRCADAEAAQELSTAALLTSQAESPDRTQGSAAPNIAALKREITSLKRHAAKAQKQESEMLAYKEDFENAKQKIRLMGVKVLDFERHMEKVSQERDDLFGKAADLEGENTALKESQDILLKDKEDMEKEIHAMRLYVSDVDKEKRRDDLLARFVRKHTAEMAPPPPKELKNIQGSVSDALLALKRQLNSGLPRAMPTLTRLERETDNLFTEIDRIRIREQDTLDALQSVVEESDSVATGKRGSGGDVGGGRETREKLSQSRSGRARPPVVIPVNGQTSRSRSELESVHNDMMKDMIGNM